MKGKIIKDWSQVDFKNPDHRKKVSGALQYFLTLPDKFSHVSGQEKEKKLLRAALQEFATTGDFPTSILPIIEKFHITTHYDTGYEEIFDIRDFSGSRRNGFDMLDVESGLTFRKVKVGEKLKVYKMAGAKARVYFEFYGGALGWHRQLFDDEEYWTLEDNAIEFRNKAYSYRAQIFYALIEALSAGQNLAWQDPDPSTLPNTNELYTANRDAQTMNKAAADILEDVKGKGYGVSPEETTFIVLTPLQLRGRIRKALNVMQQAVSGSKTQIDYNFRQITTLMLTTTNVYYVILPKKKLKGGYRMDLRLFSDFDILSYTDTQAGWMRYGGAIGDIQQLVRCSIS